MQSFQPSFDAHTLALMGRAFDEAWWQLHTQRILPLDDGAARSAMACAIMSAVANGERDPERLKTAAIRALNGREAL
jgi:hypothetical protein